MSCARQRAAVQSPLGDLALIMNVVPFLTDVEDAAIRALQPVSTPGIFRYPRKAIDVRRAVEAERWDDVQRWMQGHVRNLFGLQQESSLVAQDWKWLLPKLPSATPFLDPSWVNTFLGGLWYHHRSELDQGTFRYAVLQQVCVLLFSPGVVLTSDHFDTFVSCVRSYFPFVEETFVPVKSDAAEASFFDIHTVSVGSVLTRHVMTDDPVESLRRLLLYVRMSWDHECLAVGCFGYLQHVGITEEQALFWCKPINVLVEHYIDSPYVMLVAFTALVPFLHDYPDVFEHLTPTMENASALHARILMDDVEGNHDELDALVVACEELMNVAYRN